MSPEDFNGQNEGSAADGLTEAERYVANMLEIDRVFVRSRTARSAGSADEVQDRLFDAEPIVDTDGNPVDFYALTPEEQNIFISVWAEATVEDLRAKHDTVPGLAEHTAVNNDSMEAALERSARSADVSYADFERFFVEEMEQRSDELARRLDAVQDRTVHRATADQRRARQLRIRNGIINNYRKGRVLTTISDGSSSSSSSSVVAIGGHASIMSRNSISNSISDSANIAVSAWPDNRWEGLSDGVQYERFELWLNSDRHGRTVRGVTALRVGERKWVWNWANSGYVYTEASTSKHNSAGNYAIAQIGKPFNWIIPNKWTTDAFYCSQLVWRAWQQQGYNLSPSSPWASPVSIMNHSGTRVVFSDSHL
ncbi:hypothetical protein JCM12856_30970 [Spirochaeta dissipatitropha]